MKALTINLNFIERYSLNSIDRCAYLLKNMGITPLLISAERTENSQNIHYHVLADDFDDEIEQKLWYEKVYNQDVLNEYSYYKYITKDGNFKFFNDYKAPLSFKGNNEYSELLADIYDNDFSLDGIRLKYPELYIKHYSAIIKMLTLDVPTKKR